MSDQSTNIADEFFMSVEDVIKSDERMFESEKIKSAKIAIAKNFIETISGCTRGFIEEIEPDDLLEITFKISGRNGEWDSETYPFQLDAELLQAMSGLMALPEHQRDRIVQALQSIEREQCPF